jgi:hypothetical protein
MTLPPRSSGAPRQPSETTHANGGSLPWAVDQRGLRFLQQNIPTELGAVEVVPQVREKGTEGKHPWPPFFTLYFLPAQ